MDEREKQNANKKKWSLEDDEADEEMEQEEAKDAEGDVEMKEAETDPLEDFMAAEVLPKMEKDVKQALFLEEKAEQSAIKDGITEDTRSVQVPDAKAEKKKEIDPYDSDASDMWHIPEEEEEEDDAVCLSMRHSGRGLAVGMVQEAAGWSIE